MLKLHKNRGMFLETLINKTINFYCQNEIALFHKKEIPVIFKNVKNINHKLKIIDGWISQKSTTDYYGIFKGRFITFEVKSTINDTFIFTNVKKHQQKYLFQIHKLGGIAFLIIGFINHDQYFLIFYKELKNILKKQKKINITQIKKKGYSLKIEYPGILDFILIIQKVFKL